MSDIYNENSSKKEKEHNNEEKKSITKIFSGRIKSLTISLRFWSVISVFSLSGLVLQTGYYVQGTSDLLKSIISISMSENTKHGNYYTVVDSTAKTNYSNVSIGLFGNENKVNYNDAHLANSKNLETVQIIFYVFLYLINAAILLASILIYRILRIDKDRVDQRELLLEINATFGENVKQEELKQREQLLKNLQPIPSNIHTEDDPRIQRKIAETEQKMVELEECNPEIFYGYTNINNFLLENPFAHFNSVPIRQFNSNSHQIFRQNHINRRYFLNTKNRIEDTLGLYQEIKEVCPLYWDIAKIEEEINAIKIDYVNTTYNHEQYKMIAEQLKRQKETLIKQRESVFNLIDSYFKVQNINTIHVSNSSTKTTLFSIENNNSTPEDIKTPYDKNTESGLYKKLSEIEKQIIEIEKQELQNSILKRRLDLTDTKIKIERAQKIFTKLRSGYKVDTSVIGKYINNILSISDNADNTLILSVEILRQIESRLEQAIQHTRLLEDIIELIHQYNALCVERNKNYQQKELARFEKEFDRWSDTQYQQFNAYITKEIEMLPPTGRLFREGKNTQKEQDKIRKR